jgi:hypothetical protein
LRFQSKELGNLNQTPAHPTELKSNEEFESPSDQGRLTDDLIKKIKYDESGYFPLKKLQIIIVCFVLSVGTSFLLGTKQTPSFIGIKQCSWAYWAVGLIFLVIMTAISYLAVKIIEDEVSKKKAIDYPIGERDDWTGPKILKINIIFLLGGITCASVGLGGGAFFIPTFLS